MCSVRNSVLPMHPLFICATFLNNKKKIKKEKARQPRLDVQAFVSLIFAFGRYLKCFNLQSSFMPRAICGVSVFLNLCAFMFLRMLEGKPTP